MAGQFDLQPSFPIASVADLIASRPQKEAQMRAVQQQQLVQGLQGFGTGVQSLVDRRNAMAQALAQAKVYGQTPEGQSLMAPTQSPTPGYGAQMSPGMQGPAGPTTSTPSPVDINTLATAFRNEQPGNFSTNLIAGQKANQEMAIKQRELALKEQEEPEKLNLESRIQTMLAGIKGQEATTQASKASSEDINTLLQRRQEASGKLSTGFFNGLGNQQAKQAQLDVSDINRQLRSKGYHDSSTEQGGSGSGGQFDMPALGESVTHPSGVTIKRTK